jgi:hypothetical protein
MSDLPLVDKQNSTPSSMMSTGARFQSQRALQNFMRLNKSLSHALGASARMKLRAEEELML